MGSTFTKSLTTTGLSGASSCLIDGVSDTDCQRTCDAINVVGFDTVAPRTGSFTLYWGPTPDSQNGKYSFAYSEDGSTWTRMGSCDHYNGVQQILTDGMTLDPPAAPFKYIGVSTACWNQNLREVVYGGGGGQAAGGAPKRVQRRSKMGSRRPKLAAFSVPKASRGLKIAQEGVRYATRMAEQTPQAVQEAPRRPKSAPILFQNGPRGPRDAPRGLQEDPPRGPQEAQIIVFLLFALLQTF